MRTPEIPAKILAITKRLNELCGTQAMLYAAGMQLVTATSMAAARGTLNAVHIQAVILCRESWSAAERDSMIAELRATHPELTVLVRCPGCTDCDEAAGVPGQLNDETPIASLIAALTLPVNGRKPN